MYSISMSYTMRDLSYPRRSSHDLICRQSHHHIPSLDDLPSCCVHETCRVGLGPPLLVPCYDIYSTLPSQTACPNLTSSNLHIKTPVLQVLGLSSIRGCQARTEKRGVPRYPLTKQQCINPVTTSRTQPANLSLVQAPACASDYDRSRTRVHLPVFRPSPLRQ